jgi:hypothetical protein
MEQQVLKVLQDPQIPLCFLIYHEYI